MSAHEKVILFSRYPTAGTTKTRLIPALGAKGAAKLQRQMTENVFRQLLIARKDRGIEIEICYDGGNKARLKKWLTSPDICYSRQAKGNLGVRLHRCCLDAFAGETKQLVIVGGDCPDLSALIIRQGFTALRQNDLVLGPALDGGYYLIGLKQPHPLLFEKIGWGGDQVLNATLHQAQQLKLKVSLLTPLADIDRPEDLRLL